MIRSKDSSKLEMRLNPSFNMALGLVSWIFNSAYNIGLVFEKFSYLSSNAYAQPGFYGLCDCCPNIL